MALKVSEQKFLKEYFTYSPNPTNGVKNFSSFILGLRDARDATNRDLDTGVKLENKNHASWLGAIGYFALLDQIGKCFYKRGGELSKRSIESALRNFSNLQQSEVDALFALRCSFAHDYALFNLGKNKSLDHWFVVVADSYSPLIKLPESRWDKNFASRDASNTTFVNLQAFGDLVESISDKVRKISNTDDSDVVLAISIEQIEAQYCHSIIPFPNV